MSDKNHCPICGDEAEYLRFLDLCAERANEKWRENEVKTMIDVYTSMDFVQVVRCRDCKHYMDYEHEFEPNLGYCREFDREEVRDSCFCAWGERREP